jgi:putative protease
MAAAKKKPKPKVKRKKAPAGKPAARKKSAAKKPSPKKVVSKKAAPKATSTPKAAPRPAPKAAPRPAPVPAAPARPEPLPGEEFIGVVTHYFGHLSVAAIRLEAGGLRVGIRSASSATSDFRQRVDSMQVEHQPVTEAGKRQEIGLKVREHAREHDAVYKVTM